MSKTGKDTLVGKVREKLGTHVKGATDAVNAVFEAVADTLAEGGSIQIKGLGTFSVRQRAARKGRNPKTGKEINIAAKKAIVFKASKTNLLSRLND